MADKKIVAVMSNKTRIFGVIDGNMQNNTLLAKRTLWMPASAGMTVCVGGTSH